MKKVTRGVGWLNGLSHHPKDGTGVQTFFQPERRCAGDVVATPNGVLNGSGATPRGQDALRAPSNHSPAFFLDEDALKVGTRAMLQLVLDHQRGTGA